MGLKRLSRRAVNLHSSGGGGVLTADSLRIYSQGLTTKISTRFTLDVFLVCVDEVFQKLKCCVDKFLREFLQKLNISWFNRIHLKVLISRK